MPRSPKPRAATKPASSKPPAAPAAAPAPATMAASKYDELLRSIYYSVGDEGFGSIQDTYKAAKKKEPKITLKIVKEFLDRQAQRQKKKEGTWNSFVPREALQTIQMDIAHMPEKVFGKSEFKYALFAIDVFSKKLSVIPLKRQTSEATAKALDQIFEEDLGLPIGVYNDEGGEFMAEFAKRLKYYDVEQTTSRTPPAFVERAIRTVKEQIAKRREIYKDSDWASLIPYVVNRYNAKPHSITKVAPEDAVKDKYNKTVKKTSKRMQPSIGITIS